MCPCGIVSVVCFDSEPLRCPLQPEPCFAPSPAPASGPGPGARVCAGEINALPEPGVA